MLPGHFKSYLRDRWNIIDQAMYMIMLLAVVLRFTLDDDEFMAARYVYAVDLVLFYLRVLRLYFVNKRLGPKVVVIGRMVCIRRMARLCNAFVDYCSVFAIGWQLTDSMYEHYFVY